MPSALKKEQPALQKRKFINCFLFVWAIFGLLDPDPDFESGSGYGSRVPCESVSNPNPNTDPDSLHGIFLPPAFCSFTFTLRPPYEISVGTVVVLVQDGRLRSFVFFLYEEKKFNLQIF
jgi:hypothetical protein